MKFLALIPARYASTRFPGKPLADIFGKPMIQHVWERAREVFDECAVATDDIRIESAVKAFGGHVVMTSPDHRSGTDRCAEALARVERETGVKFDVVVNVQGDEPFVAADQLRLLTGAFSDTATDIATVARLFSQGDDIFDPNSPKVVMTSRGYAVYFSRWPIPYLRGVEDKKRWQSSVPYYKHIGLYAYRAEVLREITALPQSPLETAESLEQLRWLENGYSIRVCITDTESISVDTPEDLRRVLKNFAR